MGAFNFWFGWNHTPSKRPGRSRRWRVIGTILKILLSGGVVGVLFQVLVDWLRQ